MIDRGDDLMRTAIAMLIGAAMFAGGSGIKDANIKVD